MSSVRRFFCTHRPCALASPEGMLRGHRALTRVASLHRASLRPSPWHGATDAEPCSLWTSPWPPSSPFARAFSLALLHAAFAMSKVLLRGPSGGPSPWDVASRAYLGAEATAGPRTGSAREVDCIGVRCLVNWWASCPSRREKGACLPTGTYYPTAANTQNHRTHHTLPVFVGPWRLSPNTPAGCASDHPHKNNKYHGLFLPPWQLATVSL